MVPAVTARMLTVWQPWASLLTPTARIRELVAASPRHIPPLPKDRENRSRSTPWRGLVLVHAAKTGVDRDAMNLFGLNPDDFDYGVVVGVATLTDVVTGDPSEWAQPGRRQWVFTDQIGLDMPVPATGFQGFRAADLTVLALVLTRLEHQRRTTQTSEKRP